MMRSMFSAVSGLRAHQLRMDAIGNNIANVNTVGYKANRVTFQEVFNQTLRGAGSPQAGLGGTNPQQVGLGINVASMDTFHIRGAVERTDYNTDMMINGDGFFIVSNDANFLNRSYTRAGSFALDRDGNMVTPDGYRVLGYMADNEGVLGSNLEGLVISKAQSFPAEATDRVGYEGNLNSEAPVWAGAIVDPAGIYSIVDDRLVVNAGMEQYIARETTFEVYDGLGGIHRIKQVFVKTGVDNTDPDNPISEYSMETFYLNKDGTVIQAGGATGGTVTDPPTAPTASPTIEFDKDGRLTGTTTTLNLNIGAGLTNGAGDLPFTISFAGLTMFANESTASAPNINGFKQGTLEDFSVASTGEITGFFDNGQSRIIGRVALANFKNAAGLEKTGSNLYRVTNNSGQAIIGAPGAGGFGGLNPGALEMSNTDLSREFTNMITTQRGFQANSRIISTSDEMLQEVVNMKR
ncbi:flagellar hook protein FlgE [Anoxynatronum sibiricum]|uniref:Flagellar hook protein FlgE n=1 Tax=Anoxynatronum sibiricum TaxID=210623 RepID=A0ABU9VQL4_9CLOT